MSGIMALLRKHQLSAFFLLAFGLTWFAFVPWYWSNGDGIPWFTFGPMVAAFVMSWVAGGWFAIRALFSAMVRWRVGFVWYVVAVGLPFAIQGLAVLFNLLFATEGPAWDKIPVLSEILPMVTLYAVFSGPLGEEPGWRGFALPRLLAQRSALGASLILGAFWAAWHLPLALVGDLSIYGTVNVFLAAIVFTWVFQNTNGSILIAILMHTSHQNSVRYLGRVYTEGDYLQFQWIAVAIWAVAAIAVLTVHGRQSFKM